MPKYLNKRGSSWQFMIKVPKGAKHVFPQVHIRENFGDITERDATIKALLLADSWKAKFTQAQSTSTTDHQAIEILQIGKYDKEAMEITLDTAVGDLERAGRASEASSLYTIVKDAKTPLGPLMDEYKEYRRVRDPLKPGSLKNYKRFWKRIEEYFEFLENITRAEVHDFYETLADEYGLSGTSINLYRTAGSGFWKWCLENRKIESEAFPFLHHNLRVYHNKHVKTDYIPFTDDDIKLLFKTIREIPVQTKQHADNLRCLEHFMLPIVMYTGMRIGEICALQWKDVCLDKKYLRVNHSKTEKGVRDVPIHDTLLALMDTWERSGEYVVPLLTKREDHLRSMTIGKAFGKAKKQAGFTTRRHAFHSFRATIATKLEAAAPSLENVAADILGHEKQTMSYGLYSGGSPMDQRLDVINRISYS